MFDNFVGDNMSESIKASDIIKGSCCGALLGVSVVEMTKRVKKLEDENAALNNPWNSESSAPKDGTIFLANIGHIHVVTCTWNIVDNCWIYGATVFSTFNGEIAAYFESEYVKEGGLEAWMPLPNSQGFNKLTGEK